MKIFHGLDHLIYQMNASPRVHAHMLKEKCSGGMFIFKLDDVYLYKFPSLYYLFQITFKKSSGEKVDQITYNVFIGRYMFLLSLKFMHVTFLLSNFSFHLRFSGRDRSLAISPPLSTYLFVYMCKCTYLNFL